MTNQHRSSEQIVTFVVAVAVLAIALSIDQLVFGIVLAVLVLFVPRLREGAKPFLVSRGRVSWFRAGAAAFLVGMGVSIASIAGHYVAGFVVGFVTGILA